MAKYQSEMTQGIYTYVARNVLTLRRIALTSTVEYLYLQGILYVLYYDLSSKVYILGISHLTPAIGVGFQISISYTSLSTANAQLIQKTIRSERKICSTMKQMNP